MLKGKWKLLICGLLIVCIGFMVSNNVFAAINEGYYENYTEVTDPNLDAKITNSTITDLIGSFIYAVGSLMEWVLGKLFQLITNTNMFPWADAILFNAVPFLDVNIFTAHAGSLAAILYDFLTGTYYSLLTMASTFFGIAVMVSAIKLAITAIAEDKARYKKAIVDWILGLVMLWGMHFFISFVLYLNEQLVIVASNIASQEVKDSGEAIVKLSDTSAANTELVYNFIKTMSEGNTTIKDVILTIAIIAGAIIAIVAIVTGIGAIVGAVGTAGTFATAVSGAAAAAKGGAAAVGFAKFAAGFKVIAGVAATVLKNAAILTIAGTTVAISCSQLGETLIKVNDMYAKQRKDSIEQLKKQSDEDFQKMMSTLYSTGATRTFTFYVEENGEVKEVEKELTFNLVDVAAGLLKNDAYISGAGLPADLSGDVEFWKWEKGISKGDGKKYMATLYYDVMSLTSDCKDNSKEYCVKMGENSNSSDVEYMQPISYYSLNYYTFDNMPAKDRTDLTYDSGMHIRSKAFVDVFNNYVSKQKSQTNVISNLAAYFKETAWSTGGTGWKANKSVIQNAIMYVLLVSYSLVFFISYAKRLFYVIMLILMAPIVVVFDFFMRSTK